jgi:hypothetical protein
MHNVECHHNARPTRQIDYSKVGYLKVGILSFDITSFGKLDIAKHQKKSEA